MKSWFILTLLAILLLSGCQLNKQANSQKKPADVFQQTINKAKSTASQVNKKSSKLEKSFPLENK